MSDKEAQARIIIDRMLTESGWLLLDDDTRRKNVICEATIRSNRGTKNSDYLLLDNYNKPLAVIEAKSSHKNPLSAKTQAKNYAIDIAARFVYLSNGIVHYFWDTILGNPTQIEKFHTLDELYAIKEPQELSETKLWEIESDAYIIANLQYGKLANVSSTDLKDKYIAENKLVKLREYQVDAVRAVIGTMKAGNYRYLLEMATGTGKTFTCAGLISAFLQSKTVRRVLFLVDRLELETQALRAFNKSFNNGDIYTTQIFKDDRDSWFKADILISTVQSLCKNERYIEFFSPSDFDLVVVDEAHRSISGKARKLFEYFIGYKIGLTATPKNYFRGIEDFELQQNDVYEYENRKLRDTYITFGCEPGKPTYSFTLKDGVGLKMLVNPFAIDARTTMTVELLSKDGLKLDVPSDDKEDSEEQIEIIFKGKDFEKKLKSEETNISFCKAFMENAKRDPISGEIGKSIVYCVSQDHAAKITNILNKMAMELFPNMYNSDFAEQVTSHVENAQKKTLDFCDESNNLNGKSKWLDGYETSKTRVCVTVAMMTTGYDCKDLLNIVLMRPIFSPSEFIQIKGRGTRIFDFTHQDKLVKKDNFYLFDFFAVCEYFEVDFDYDKALKVPKGNNGSSYESSTGRIAGEVELTDIDPLHHIKGAQVGEDGMRIDNDFYIMDKLKQEMLKDEELKKAVHRKDWNIAIKIVEEKYAHNPKFKNITIEQISSDMKLERIATWREFVELVYGVKNHLKTRAELLEDAIQNCSKLFFVDELKKITIRKLIEAYIKSDVVREAIDCKKFTMLDTVGLFSFNEFKTLGENGKQLAEKIKDIIPEELLRRAS